MPKLSQASLKMAGVYVIIAALPDRDAGCSRFLTTGVCIIGDAAPNIFILIGGLIAELH